MIIHNRILFLTQYFPPEIGAPQSRLYETALGLKERGWEVAVVTALPNYPSGRIFKTYKRRFFQKETVNGLEVWRYWLFASNSKNSIPRILSMLSFSLTVLCSLKKIRRFQPHFILTESPPLTLGLSGLILAYFCGGKHLLNVSDLWPLSASKLGAIKEKSKVYRLLEKLEHFLYRKSFACIGQSNQIKNHLEISGAQKTVLFRNGVDIKRFNVLDDFDQKPKPIKVVYAGLLGVAQGILSYCKELNFNPDHLVFHIYGDGAERENIEKYLSETKKPGIFLHNPISREAIPNMLVQYDFTFIPLVIPIYGAVPSKIYEAMAAGLPIIFAGGGEGAEIIQNFNLGWVCSPSDFKSIQLELDKISRLSIKEINNKRRNCIEASKNLFNRDTQIDHLNQWLKEND